MSMSMTMTITSRQQAADSRRQTAKAESREPRAELLCCGVRVRLATMSEAKRFGSEVPAAVTVRPITSSGIPKRQPDDSAAAAQNARFSLMLNTVPIFVPSLSWQNERLNESIN
jgi:hypothetical protein